MEDEEVEGKRRREKINFCQRKKKGRDMLFSYEITDFGLFTNRIIDDQLNIYIF
jgi:hypothetical protein